jgi:hypothetical protein
MRKFFKHNPSFCMLLATGFHRGLLISGVLIRGYPDTSDWTLQKYTLEEVSLNINEYISLSIT